MLKLSICIVAYNEERFLPSLLDNICQQEYPHRYIEVVLIDGNSTDRTKQLMLRFQQEKKEFYNIQVLNNPKRIQAAGWNIAIKYFTGDVLARIDAHTMLPAAFSRLVMRDIQAGEDIVGGKRPCLIENNTKWGRALLAAENSLFGSSINLSRRSDEVRYVNTMFHASYRREVFDKVGLFNELLLRTEDNEMHYRMRKAGYKLYYDPEIISYQYARSSFKKMIRQKAGNGYWIGVTLKECPGCISIYHLIPGAFVVAIIVTTALALIHHPGVAVLMWSLYGVFAIISMLISLFQEAFNGFKLLMPVLFLILHVSYGSGTLIGLFRQKRGA